jgi:hypothetical protein
MKAQLAKAAKRGFVSPSGKGFEEIRMKQMNETIIPIRAVHQRSLKLPFRRAATSNSRSIIGKRLTSKYQQLLESASKNRNRLAGKTGEYPFLSLQDFGVVKAPGSTGARFSYFHRRRI